MESELFRSKIRELSNIISGRFSVHINEIFGSITDIEVPNEHSFMLGKEYNEFSCEAYIFYTEFILDQKDVSIILFIKKNILDSIISDTQDFFMEIGEDIKFIICEIVRIFSESDDFTLEKFSFNCDFLSSIFSDELQKRMKVDDNIDFISNKIFLKPEKKDFGGILVFYS